MSIDLGSILGDTADALGVGSSEGIADVLAKNINLGIQKLKPGEPVTATNPPTVQPTKYASDKSGSLPIAGFQLSANQAKVLIFAGIGLIAVIGWKVLRKK